MSEEDSINDFYAHGAKTLLLLAPIAIPVGVIVSLGLNPFVAEVGLVKGAFAHLLVGAGAGIGAAGGSLVGCVHGMFLRAAGATANKFLRREGKHDWVLVPIGVLAGAVCGGGQGYNFTTGVVDRGLHAFEEAAVRLTARDAPAPFRLTMQNGRAVAIFARKPALG